MYNISTLDYSNNNSWVPPTNFQHCKFMIVCTVRLYIFCLLLGGNRLFP